MISVLLSILAWKNGLGFSVLLGASGVFYLSTSKKRLDTAHSTQSNSVESVIRKDDEDSNQTAKTEDLEL